MKNFLQLLSIILAAITLYCIICGYIDNDPAGYVTGGYMAIIALLVYSMSMMVGSWVTKTGKK